MAIHGRQAGSMHSEAVSKGMLGGRRVCRNGVHEAAGA